MKTHKSIALLLVFSVLLCFTGCAENSPEKTEPRGSSVASEPEDTMLSPEPSFVEYNSIQAALPTPGDATVTMLGDETIDLTGIPLSGRKEIILNGHTLTLTGNYGVSMDAVLDIKPGEDAEGSTLNLTGLMFDFGFLDVKPPPELPLIEIRPGVALEEPEYPEGVSLREFTGILTVIQCD